MYGRSIPFNDVKPVNGLKLLINNEYTHTYSSRDLRTGPYVLFDFGRVKKG